MHQSLLKALVVMAPLVISACQTKDGKKSNNPETPQNSGSAGAKVSYDNFVKGWLSRECTKCHSADGDSPDLSTYELAKQHASEILASIQDKENPMPKGGPLPSKDVVDKIKAWVKAGKPKTVSSKTGNSSDPEVSNTTKVTYVGWMQSWLEDNCTSCHRANGTASPDLSTYEQAKLNIDDIITSIQNQQDPMPKGGPLPPASIVAKVKAWRQAGTPRDDAPAGGNNNGGNNTGGNTPGGNTPGGNTPGGNTPGGNTPGGNTPGGSALNQVTYESYVRGWLAQNCTSCHSSGRENPDLTTYQGARAAASESLQRIRSTDPGFVMPPRSQPAAADVQQKLQDWINSGYRER